MEKVQFLEWLRVICAVAVIINHSLITAVSVFGTPAGILPQVAVHGTIGIVLFAVPVFLMITGYLLLNPNREVTFEKAIRKYAYRIAMVLLVVGSAFAWMEIVFSKKAISAQQIPIAFFNMIQGHSWTHLWYLYVLIGLYLFIPVLKASVNTFGKRGVDILIVTMLLFDSIIPYIEANTSFEFGIKFPIVTVYALYMLIGYRLSITPPRFVTNCKQQA